jgi:hypothetical protein
MEEGFVNGNAVWVLANIALNAMAGGIGALAAVGRLASLRGGGRVVFAHVLHRAQLTSTQVYYNMEDNSKSRGNCRARERVGRCRVARRNRRQGFNAENGLRGAESAEKTERGLKFEI